MKSWEDIKNGLGSIPKVTVSIIEELAKHTNSETLAVHEDDIKTIASKLNVSVEEVLAEAEILGIPIAKGVE